MVEVKETQMSETVKAEDAKVWTKALPRPAIPVRLCPVGATIDGVLIQPGHYAVLTDAGKVIDIAPELIRAFYTVA